MTNKYAHAMCEVCGVGNFDGNLPTSCWELCEEAREAQHYMVEGRINQQVRGGRGLTQKVKGLLVIGIIEPSMGQQHNNRGQQHNNRIVNGNRCSKIQYNKNWENGSQG